MITTSKRKLKKPEYDDPVDIHILNENMDILDNHTHQTSDIQTDGNYRFVSDTEKAAWNGKVDKAAGKSLVSDTEITRLLGLYNYTHPANHSPSIISQDVNNRFVTDAEKNTWSTGANTASSAYSYADSINSSINANGSWTPKICGGVNSTVSGITYSKQDGYYWKIGKLVTCTFNIYMTGTNTTLADVVVLGGLPYTPKNDWLGCSVANIALKNMNTNSYYQITTLNPSTYGFSFVSFGANQAWSSILFTGNIFKSNSELVGRIIYTTT